jgi:hypothetical protein
MKTIDCTNWSEFQAHLTAMRSAPIKTEEKSSCGHPGDLIFRGQSDASYNLTTTLERSNRHPYTTNGYLQTIRLVKDEIESFSGRHWPWVRPQDIQNDNIPETVANAYPSRKTFPFDPLAHELPNFAYMTYLRHFGFPSPLLDWTRSPYIAAYFGGAAKLDCSWAIYAFDEMPEGFKIDSAPGAEASITTIKQGSVHDRRHFLQQSLYTVCTAFDNEWKYVPHDTVWKRGNPKQDILTKFVFPAEARVEIRRILQEINVNSYSLFGTEESLVQTLANRRF